MAEHAGNADGVMGDRGKREGDVGSSLPVGALLRAEADGELSPEQSSELERRVSACECGVTCACRGKRVEFERTLRSACERVIGCGCAPASLREKVAGMARAAEVDSRVVKPVVHDASRGHGAVPGRAIAGRRRVMMWGGVALVLVMLTGVVYQALVNSRAVSDGQTTFTAQLASFMSVEHERTAIDTDPGRAKFTCREAGRVCDEFREVLGESPALPALDGAEHLSFQGAARCGVPGGPSIHARFYVTKESDGSRHEVSLFIQRDTGLLALEEGVVYRMDCPRRAACVWRRGGLVYYSVADDGVGCAALRAAAGVGDPVDVVRVK